VLDVLGVFGWGWDLKACLAMNDFWLAW